MTDKPIVNINDLPAREIKKGSRFEARAVRAGAAAGAELLGASHYTVPPGKTAFPKHSHRANEEMIIVLDGEGTYTCGDRSWPVKAGDVIAALAGDASTAHVLVNSGTTDLVYWCISTRNDPDICEYPDSGKYMVASGVPAAGGMTGADFVIRGRDKPMLDYYDGEDVGEEE